MFRYVFILLLISSCGKIPIANKAKPAAIHKSPLYDTLNKGDINSIDKTGSDGNGNDANIPENQPMLQKESIPPEQAEQNLMLNNPIPEQYKVFFKAGSAELDNTTRQILQETANNAIHLKPNKILINGNTDRTGPLQYNSELATKRANSVARFLIIMGVPENILDVRSYGESAAWADQAPKDKDERYRNVEIIFAQRAR